MDLHLKFTTYFILCFTQSNTAEYRYKPNVHISSIERAHKLCEQTEGFSLISINSHKEQLWLQQIFSVLKPFCSISTIYALIGLKNVNIAVHIHELFVGVIVQYYHVVPIIS